MNVQISELTHGLNMHVSWFLRLQNLIFRNLTCITDDTFLIVFHCIAILGVSFGVYNAVQFFTNLNSVFLLIQPCIGCYVCWSTTRSLMLDHNLLIVFSCWNLKIEAVVFLLNNVA